MVASYATAESVPVACADPQTSRPMHTTWTRVHVRRIDILVPDMEHAPASISMAVGCGVDPVTAANNAIAAATGSRGGDPRHCEHAVRGSGARVERTFRQVAGFVRAA